MSPRVLENVVPANTRGTVLGTLGPMLGAAGVEISESRLAAVLGHAFTFSMVKGGGEVWQLANIEWCLFFRELELLPVRFEHFDAILKGPRPAPNAEALAKMKSLTWDRVRASIDRRVPAIAWQALTVEQRDAGVNGWEWSLLVGYDESDRSYVVRNQNHSEPWTVGHDRFGYTDPVNWYHVMVFAEPRPVDPDVQRQRTLKQAIDYAYGNRFPPGGGCYAVDAVGLAAYELFRDALTNGGAAPAHAAGHASFLSWSRTKASEYLREVELPKLVAVAELYDAEAEATDSLRQVCQAAADDGGFEPSSRWEAARLLDVALDAERRAIWSLETI